MPPNWQRQRLRIQALAPVALTILLIFLSVTPLGLPYFGAVAPLYGVIAVYYWSIYRPDLLPAPAVFAVGLLQDLLTGLPIGLSAMTFLAVHAVCVSQRRFFVGKSFGVGWWGFAVIALGAVSLSFIIATVFHVALLDPRPLLVQVVISIAVYPAFDWLFGRTEMTILRRA